MLEKQIQKKILQYLKTIGFATKYHVGAYAEAGVPDILACIDGRFVAIEVKREGQKPTLLQSQKIAEIRAAGGLAFVASSVEEVKEMLK